MTDVIVSLSDASGNPQPFNFQVAKDDNGNTAYRSYQAPTATKNKAIAAGATGAQVVKNAPGFLGTILLLEVPGADIVAYDNAGAASGTVIGFVPAGASPGAYPMNMPAAAGITLAGSGLNPDITVSYQ